VWRKSQNSQSGSKYFEMGDACFESAFLFNKYFKNESFSIETLSLIELRIKGKYKHIKKNIPKSMNLYKHYENFLLNIENMKKLSS
jgi:hypothetical protein